MKNKARALAVTKILFVAFAASEASAQTPAAGKETPELIALRDELAPLDREQAISKINHFRPLCDKDGYPLVGNLARKAPTYEPSQFCAEVRKMKGNKS